MRTSCLRNNPEAKLLQVCLLLWSEEANALYHNVFLRQLFKEKSNRIWPLEYLPFRVPSLSETRPFCVVAFLRNAVD